MEPIEYLRGIRRRWLVIVASVLIALTAGWATTEVAPPTPIEPSYEATTVLLAQEGVDGLGSRTLAALVTLGDVPVRVATTLGYAGDPLELAARASATVDEDTSLLRIAAIGSSEREAAELADTFAMELIESLRDRSSANVDAEADALRQRMKGLKNRLRELDAQLRSSSGTQAESLQIQREAVFEQLVGAQTALDQVQAQPTQTTGIQIVQEAIAEPVEEVGFQAPQSGTARMAVAAVIGLLAGLVLALLLERYDRRIWTKEDAERHFGAPVLSEVPRIPWSKRRGDLKIVASERPGSASADAFRRLGAEMIRGLANEASDGEKRDRPRTILIASGAPAEGKTSVVANLAAALAQLGKRVIVLSCDFSRPRIHQLLGLPDAPGLTDALRSNDPEVLDGLVKPTPIDGVSFVATGSGSDEPGLLSSGRMLGALAEASRRADVVLIDTAPLLATSDAVPLLDAVDTVLIVGRAGRTTAEQAERTGELLRRRGVPVIGVVLNASPESVLPARYYRHYTDAHREAKDTGFSPTSMSPRTGGNV